MHELSIVLSIIETAEEQVRKHEARRVESIDLPGPGFRLGGRSARHGIVARPA